MRRVAAFLVAIVRFFIQCGNRHPRLKLHCERLVGHTGKCQGIDPWSKEAEHWT